MIISISSDHIGRRPQDTRLLTIIILKAITSSISITRVDASLVTVNQCQCLENIARYVAFRA